ncbi:hypothetical protein Gasu2_56260 [Galdieria sulphuraria]|nr:hypothetical protein Gasu2_56260 [Galdieria sulphuraria]
MNIRLDVKLQAAGFTPSSELRADLIASLNQHKEKQQLWRNQHKVIRKLSPVSSRETSPRHISGRRGDRKLAYVVCQLAGRWVAERNWIIPFVYNCQDEGCLSVDNDGQFVLDSSSSPIHDASDWQATGFDSMNLQSSEDGGSCEKADLDIPSVCKAALEDALHWGISGVEGYSGFIFRYPPQVILTNQNINAEHALVVHLSCRLPDYIPPSFRGTSMKYQYLLAIVAADASRIHKPQVLRIPLIFTTSQATSVVRPIYIPWTMRPDYKQCSFKSKNGSFRVHACIMPSRDNIQRMIALSPNGRITPFDKRDEDPRQFAVSYPVSEETIFDCKEEQTTDRGALVLQDDDIQGPHTFPYLSQKDIYSTDDNIQSIYQIKQGSDIVCRIYVLKRAFRCGDSIVGDGRTNLWGANGISEFRAEHRIHVKYSFGCTNGPVDAQDMKYHELLGTPLSEVDYLLQRNTKLLNWCLPLVVYGGDRFAFVPNTVMGLDLLYDT